MITEEQQPEENNVAPETLVPDPVQQKQEEQQTTVEEQKPPVEEEEITLPNGCTYKKDHLEYINDVPYVKPEFKSLYRGSGFMYGSGRPGATLSEDVSWFMRETSENFQTISRGAADVAVDLFTTVGNRLGMNLENINKQWDEMSKFDDPARQKVRKLASVLLPSFMGGQAISARTLTLQAPKLVKAGVTVGGVAAYEGALASFQDTALEDGGIVSKIAEVAPPQLGLPRWLKKSDKEPLEVTRARAMLENTGLSVLADTLGIATTVAPRMLKWFQPKDDVAKAYKKAIVDNSDAETVTRIAELEQALATKPNQANSKVLREELDKLKGQLAETGTTDATTKSNLQRTIEANETSRRAQMEEEAIIKLEADPQTYGTYMPELTPGLANSNELARRTIDPEAVASNMVDTTMIKMGKRAGDPAPMLSGPFLKRGLVLGKSRNAMAGLAEATRDAGDFDAVVDGFRITRQQMKDEAWNIHGDIIRAGSKEDVAKLFVTDRDVKNILGKKVSYLNTVQEEQAKNAIADLTDLWLGRDITEVSARVMDTLGREIATASEAGIAFKELTNDDRVQEIILDKLEYLISEVGLSKYIAGWQLKNQDWINRMRKSADPGELAELINNEFQQALDARHSAFKNFRSAIEDVKKQNPSLVRPFYEAFSDSNGDVDTIEKLFKYAQEQVSPMGLLRSTPGLDGKADMNVFARGLHSIWMNNVLSVKSALNAAKGNVGAMVLKPITSIIGHGIGAVVQRDMEVLKRPFYYHGALFQTQLLALKDAGRRMKRVHGDYDFLMTQIREDYVVKETKKWDQLEAVAAEWERTGDRGHLMQWGWAKANRDIARMKWGRLGLTGLSGVDAYTDTIQAATRARLRAYDDVFTKKGTVDAAAMKEAEDAHYASMFNEDGMLVSEDVKRVSGEISLNLDDGLASRINEVVEAAPIMKPWFMFPKTNINDFKYALSYTPFTMIPPFKNKYGKVLLAGDDQAKIVEALAEHGVSKNDPNAMAIFEDLKHEYMGRIAFGQMSAISMAWYALSGNIRGNGPQNASQRKMLRDNYGWEPKTINIGGYWVSYKGIPGVDRILSIVGDAAYYYNDIGGSAFEDITNKVGYSIAASYFNETPLHSVEPILSGLNGEKAAWDRMTANLIRMNIPQSGNLAIVSDAITASQKDIYDDLLGYVANRIPGASSMLPEQRDLWTGEPLNDIDNDALRAMNAISPIKISSKAEPWRDWLMRTGYDGISRMRFTSEGSREYTAEERDLIGQYFGETKPWKKVQAIMNNKEFNRQIKEMREFRRGGRTYEEVKLKEQELPVYQYLDNIVNNAKEYAEARLMQEHPEVWTGVQGQLMVDKALGRGDIKGAQQAAEWTDNKVQQVREIRKLANP